MSKLLNQVDAPPTNPDRWLRVLCLLCIVFGGVVGAFATGKSWLAIAFISFIWVVISIGVFSAIAVARDEGQH